MQERTPSRKEVLTPAEEWEKAKKKIMTLYDSEAVRLLWQLSEYINSDPRLSEPVRGKRPILKNGILLTTQEAISIALSDESAKYFIIDNATKDNTKFQPSKPFWKVDVTPSAVSTVFYNLKEIELKEEDKLIPDIQYSYLQTECYRDDEVTVKTGYIFLNTRNYSRLRGKTIPDALKNTDTVDYVLGELYQENPALPYNLRRLVSQDN